MIRMMLCPNCRTIRKAGTVCPLCGCPVEPPSKPSQLIDARDRPKITSLFSAADEGLEVA